MSSGHILHSRSFSRTNNIAYNMCAGVLLCIIDLEAVDQQMAFLHLWSRLPEGSHTLSRLVYPDRMDKVIISNQIKSMQQSPTQQPTSDAFIGHKPELINCSNNFTNSPFLTRLSSFHCNILFYASHTTLVFRVIIYSGLFCNGQRPWYYFVVLLVGIFLFSCCQKWVCLCLCSSV